MSAIIRLTDAATGLSGPQRVLPSLHTCVSYAKQCGRVCWRAQTGLQAADPWERALGGHQGVAGRSGTSAETP